MALSNDHTIPNRDDTFLDVRKYSQWKLQLGIFDFYPHLREREKPDLDLCPGRVCPDSSDYWLRPRNQCCPNSVNIGSVETARWRILVNTESSWSRERIRLNLHSLNTFVLDLITLISVFRYIAVCRPHQYRTISQVTFKHFIVVTWSRGKCIFKYEETAQKVWHKTGQPLFQHITDIYTNTH